jgi:hypothetical protein
MGAVPATGRKGDWERALSAYLAACEALPYAWGEHDCLMFAAGAELAMTGEDPAADIRGRYCSKWSAAELLRDLGHGSLEDAIDARKTAVPVAMAQRGDWVLHDGAVGVSAGRVALFVGDVLRQAQDGREESLPGLIRVPRAAWQKAWRVP